MKLTYPTLFRSCSFLIKAECLFTHFGSVEWMREELFPVDLMPGFSNLHTTTHIKPTIKCYRQGKTVQICINCWVNNDVKLTRSSDGSSFCVCKFFLIVVSSSADSWDFLAFSCPRSLSNSAVMAKTLVCSAVLYFQDVHCSVQLGPVISLSLCWAETTWAYYNHSLHKE